MRPLNFAFLAVLALLAAPVSAATFTTSPRLDTYTADNVGNLTITGVDSWGTQNGGQVTFNGTTSGTTILKPSAVASGTLTLPAATDTLVGKATTDTLTNKTLTAPTFTSPVLGVATATSINGLTITTTTGTLTIPNGVTLTGPASSGTAATLAGTETLSAKTLTSPVINGPPPVACGSTCTLGAANRGTFTLLDTAAGSVATLPGATGTGNIYRLVVSVANSSNSDKVLLATTTDVIIGTAIGETGGTAKIFVGNAGTYHSLQMPFAGTQPSGGFVGDTYTCTDIATATWLCNGTYQAGTTPTTPYSASTT